MERSIETDVIIVGAGISGALTADSLTEAGMRVVIVDRRGAVRGSTVATTALVLFEIDTPLVDLARHLGRARAERAWKRSARAVVDLANRAETARISCAWQWREALYLLGDRTESNDLAERCWDCPCHGSHFAPDAEALNAPAVSALAEVAAADVGRRKPRRKAS